VGTFYCKATFCLWCFRKQQNGKNIHLAAIFHLILNFNIKLILFNEKKKKNKEEKIEEEKSVSSTNCKTSTLKTNYSFLHLSC